MLKDETTRKQLLKSEIKLFEEFDDNKVSLLYYAIFYGHAESALVLIGAGADITEISPNGSNFFHRLGFTNQWKGLQSMLRTKQTENQYLQKMCLVIKAIAAKNVIDINQVNNKGESPFTYALRLNDRRYPLLLEAFIECGALISEKQYDVCKEYAITLHQLKHEEAEDLNHLMKVIEAQPQFQQYRENFFKKHPELQSKEPKEVTAPCSNPTVDLETPYSQTSQNANLNQKSTSSTLLKIGGVTASSIGLVTSLVVANKKHADFCKKKPTKKDEKADKAQENFDAPKNKKPSSTENIKRYFTTVYQTPSKYKIDIASHVGSVLSTAALIYNIAL